MRRNDLLVYLESESEPRPKTPERETPISFGRRGAGLRSRALPQIHLYAFRQQGNGLMIS